MNNMAKFEKSSFLTIEKYLADLQLFILGFSESPEFSASNAAHILFTLSHRDPLFLRLKVPKYPTFSSFFN